jgi:hypothetical protein
MWAVLNLVLAARVLRRWLGRMRHGGAVSLTCFYFAVVSSVERET